MSWGRSYRNWSIPRLVTYKEASDWEHRTKPIRGDKNGTKPLGDRKKKYFNIRKDEQTQDIIVKMHNTDIVRYKPSGELILNNGGWSSASTHDMFNMLTGLSMKTFNNRTWVSCYVRSGDGVTHGSYPFPSDQPVKAVRHNHDWLLENVGLTVQHFINRKAANRVRKLYPEFRAYFTGLIKLRTEYQSQKVYWNNEEEHQAIIRIPREELTEHGLDAPSTIVAAERRFAPRADNLRGWMLSNRTEDHYRAALTIMRSSHYSRYWIGQSGIVLEPSRILKLFDQLLLFIHRNEVLEQKVITSGKIVKDSYAGWVGE